MFGSEARSERVESGTPAKGEISQRWEDGECFQWNAKGQCTQGDACNFPPRWEATWKSNATVLFCSKTADSKRWEICLMESLLEARVRDRAKTTAVEKCTTSSCDSWHPPVCQNYKAGSGCKFGEQSALLCTERLTVSQTNDRKRMVVKFLLPYWRIPGNWSLRIPGQRAAEIQFDFYGRTQNPWDRSAAWNSHKAHYATQKKWERKSPSQGITQQSEPHERNPYAQKFVDRTQQETLQTRTMRQQRRVGNGTRYSEAWRKGQSHTLLALRSLVSTSAINRLFQFDCKYVSSIVYRRTRVMILVKSSNSNTHNVEVQAFRFWETSCQIPQKPKTQVKMRTPCQHGGNLLRDLPEWSEELTENLED